MKKFNIKHILSCVLAAGTLFAVASCSDAVNDAAQKGYATVIQKRVKITEEVGYTTFRFVCPENGSDKIYAEKVAAWDDAREVAYYIKGQTSSELPYETLEVYFKPSDGKALVTVQEHIKTAGDHKTWSYEVTGIDADDYHEPKGEGGIFTLDVTRDPEHGVVGNVNFADLTYRYYPLLQMHIVAPMK